MSRKASNEMLLSFNIMKIQYTESFCPQKISAIIKRAKPRAMDLEQLLVMQAA